MIINEVKSNAFLTFRLVFVLTIGFVLAWIKVLFLLIAFAIPLLLLLLATFLGLIVQHNYQHFIQDILENPNEAEFIGAIANGVIDLINFCIDILRILIEIWDMILPMIIMVLDAIWPAVTALLTDIFGTPNLLCILSEIVSALFEVFDSVMIGFERIMTAAEMGMEYDIKTRGMNAMRLFVRDYIVDRSGEDNQTMLSRVMAAVPPDQSIDSDTPPSDPGTDGTCPAQSVFLSKIVPFIEILIQIISLLTAAVTPMLVVAVRITIISLIQILPQLLTAIGQIMQALTTNGVFGKFFQLFKDTLSLIAPAWGIICPGIAAVLWLLCQISRIFSGLIGWLISNIGGLIKDAVDDIVCGVYHLVYGKREDGMHGLGFFLLNPKMQDPLMMFAADGMSHPDNPAKYNVLFTRSPHIPGNRKFTVTNALIPTGKHHNYHRHTIFRPSNKRLGYEEEQVRPRTTAEFPTHGRFAGYEIKYDKRAIVDSMSNIAQFVGDAVLDHVPSHHKRDLIDTQDTILETFELMRGTTRLATDFAQVNSQNIKAATALRSTTMVATVDDSASASTTSDRTSGSDSGGMGAMCSGPSQDENTYGTDDDDDITDGTGDGGGQNYLAADTNDNTPARCKSVWAMCQCTKGVVGEPGTNGFQQFKKVTQCEVQNIKRLFSDIEVYIKDFVAMSVSLFESLPAIISALLQFFKELEEDIKDFINVLISNESVLINSLLNTVHYLGGLGVQLDALNYTAYQNAYPQQQPLGSATVVASPEMACPDNSTLAEQEVDPRCPIYYCLQKNKDPSLCYFSNQHYPGKVEGAAQPQSFQTTFEPLSRTEFQALDPADQMRVRNRYKVETVRRGTGRQAVKVPDRYAWRALFKMYKEKRLSSMGIKHEAYVRMVNTYERLQSFLFKPAEDGSFSQALFYSSTGHAYSYEPGNILDQETTPVPPPGSSPPPAPEPAPSPTPSNSTTCYADIHDPYKCCTPDSSAYECCRGLPLCIPPIPSDVYLKPWTGLDWIGNITEQTCEPFSNGLKEVLFIIRISVGQFAYQFIIHSPNSFVMGFWQGLIGWMTFPNNQLPPYAFVCFAVNIGGLLLLMLILTLIFILYEGFAEYLADLADIFEAFKQQHEIDDIMQNSQGGGAQGMMMMGLGSTSLSIRPGRQDGPRTKYMKGLRMWLESQSDHVA